VAVAGGVLHRGGSVLRRPGIAAGTRDVNPTSKRINEMATVSL
jgi:hypothetical protein